MVLFLVCSTATLIVINIGGTIQPWGSPAVISCIVVSVLSLIALAVHQRYIAKNPAFPRQVFSRPVTNVAFLGSLFGGLLLSMIFYNLVLFWEGVRHMDTMDVGVVLLSVSLTYATSAALTGIAIKQCGRIKWATIVGTVFSTLGLGLMYYMTQSTPMAPLIVISMLVASGCGIFLPAMVNTILASTENHWHCHAIAMRMLTYTAGQCMGVSIGLAIFTNVFAKELVTLKNSTPFDLGGITPQSLMRVIKDLPPDSEVYTLIVNALRCIWVAASVMAFVAGILACVLKCPNLPEDRKAGIGPADEEKRQDEVDDSFSNSEARRTAEAYPQSEGDLTRHRSDGA